MKKQIWLRPDQVDLVVTCLKHVRSRCVEHNALDGQAAIAAKGFFIRRLDEVMEIVQPRVTPQEYLEAMRKPVPEAAAE